MSPFDVTLAASILVLGGYALAGFRLHDRSDSYERFFLADRRLTTGNVRNTFTGAAISVSTVLSFFLTLGVLFGYQILWSPFTLALGVVFFAHAVYPRLIGRPWLRSALRGESDRSIDSLPDLVDRVYGSRTLTLATAVLTGIGVLAVLVAEMMVGVSIYAEYFLRPEYIVFIIAVTLFLYAGFGGMAAVVETDKWQVWLVTFSLIAVVLVLFLQERAAASPPSPGFVDLFVPETWEPTTRMPPALLLNILVVNLCFLPSSLRVWQVVVASSKEARFKLALWQATGLILLVTVLAVLISRVMTGLLSQELSLPLIFSYIATSDDFVAAYIVYPLFITAMLSALVSTADSALIPLAQLVSGKKAGNWRRGRSWLSIFILTAGSVALYFLVTKVFGLGLVAWILTVFSITTCVAPVVLAPLFLQERQFTGVATRLIELGAIGGFLVAFAWSVWFGDNLAVQAWNCVIGFSISAALTLLGFWVSPVKTESSPAMGGA